MKAVTGNYENALDLLLAEGLAEIARDPTLTAREKVSQKAKLMREYRSAKGKVERVSGRADRTSPGRAFANSAARSLGSSLIRALIRSFR